MTPRDAAQMLQEKHEEIFFRFRQVLQQAGIHGVDLHKFELKLGGYNLICSDLTGDGCPPGQKAELICVEQPDGSYECALRCMPA